MWTVPHRGQVGDAEVCDDDRVAAERIGVDPRALAQVCVQARSARAQSESPSKRAHTWGFGDWGLGHRLVSTVLPHGCVAMPRRNPQAMGCANPSGRAAGTRCRNGCRLPTPWRSVMRRRLGRAGHREGFDVPTFVGIANPSGVLRSGSARRAESLQQRRMLLFSDIRPDAKYPACPWVRRSQVGGRCPFRRCSAMASAKPCAKGSATPRREGLPPTARVAAPSCSLGTRPPSGGNESPPA